MVPVKTIVDTYVASDAIVSLQDSCSSISSSNKAGVAWSVAPPCSVVDKDAETDRQNRLCKDLWENNNSVWKKDLASNPSPFLFSPPPSQVGDLRNK